MRVLHCLWSGETGGAERAVYQLVREQLRAGGISPAVLFGRPEGLYWDRMRELGCPTVTAQLPHGHAVARIGAVAALMRPYELVHFHSGEPLLMLASMLCRGQRRVYTHRGGTTSYSPKKRLQYGATGALLRRGFHGLSGNTAHAARCAADLFRIDPARFRVTYNGLDFGLLRPTTTPSDARAALGLGADDFVLGTAANLKAWKRIDRLLHAQAALGRAELRLLIVGDGEERTRLEGLAARLGIASQTIFAGMQSDVGNLLQVMDAFCLPSTGLESFGNAAVEAMGCGVPTVVFADGGGTTEHIETGVTGFVVADDVQLRDVLAAMLDDRALAARIGAAGCASVRARYTPLAAAKRYEQLYAAATGRRQSTNPTERNT